MSKLIEAVAALRFTVHPDPDELDFFAYKAGRNTVLDQVVGLIGQHEELRAWQPIETAPKDGTWILVRQTGTLEPSVVVYAFDSEWSETGWWMFCDGKNPEIPLRGPAPTHWVPLPPPPAASVASTQPLPRVPG